MTTIAELGSFLAREAAAATPPPPAAPSAPVTDAIQRTLPAVVNAATVNGASEAK
jgi:hypothetical protein